LRFPADIGFAKHSVFNGLEEEKFGQFLLRNDFVAQISDVDILDAVNNHKPNPFERGIPGNR
jgi:hypothetical protein